MKLFELHQGTSASLKDVEAYMSGGIERGPIQTSAGEVIVLGAGVEAVAYKERGVIGITKVMSSSQEDLKNNAYIKYANISRRLSKSNPFLPRIDSITPQQVPAEEWKRLRVAAGVENEPEEYYNHPAYLITIKLEKLLPIQRVGIEHLEAMYRKAFGSDPDNLDNRDRAQYRNALIHQLSRGVENIARSNQVYDKEWTKELDPNLVQAVLLINAIKKKVPQTVWYDLHSKNVMVRFAVGGPQLVITDPLC